MNVYTLSRPSLGLAEFDEARTLLSQYGSVLVRGSNLDPSGFETLTTHFCDRFHHVGARHALRRTEGDGLTTRVPSKNFILLGHSEGYFRPTTFLPDVGFFMCLVAPSEDGGETTLIDGVELLNQLNPALRQRLEQQGVIYEFMWEPARWLAEFDVKNETALRAYLQNFPNARYTLSKGALHMRFSAPAITYPHEGQAAFANGILAHLPEIDHPRYTGLPVHTKSSNRVYFGNGEPLSGKEINQVIDAHDKVAYRHRWQTGDVLIIDNARYMHGRGMTAAACERILISRFGLLRKSAPTP